MSKAEERALGAYPDFDAGSAKVVQCFQRQCYINGYEQAEKDLELTAEDIREIFNKVRAESLKWTATEACFPDVAKWFNEYKGAKK